MKCKGRIKDKNTGKVKVAQICNSVIDDHAIFCPFCGTPTEALSTSLSARKVFREQWNEQRQEGMKFTVTGIILMAVVLALIFSAFYLTVEMYYITNLVILFLVPFLLIPFTFNWENGKVEFSLNNYLARLKYYPVSWLFVLANLLYYFLLKVICTGYLLTVATDPILHLVRLILSIYWLAVIFPVPFLLFKKKIPLFKAFKAAYIAGAETRWQHFHLLLFITLLNLVAIIPLGLGLIFTLPVSYRIMHRYYTNMDEYKLFDIGEE